MLEAARKLLASVVGNNEKERQFCTFSEETKVGLVGTGDDWQCIFISNNDARQRLSRFEVEREKMESWSAKRYRERKR